MIIELIYRIKHKLMKLRLQPIRVYCLHHVCAKYDAESMNACDWMQIDEFKSTILSLQKKGVEFISLTEAYRHFHADFFRKEKYAVLTFDDGYASLKEILPWLDEQHIPATLFINGKYLDGKSFRKNPKERYLTKADLMALTSPLIEIGSHGWEHLNAAEMTDEEFQQSVCQNKKTLQDHPRYVPFYAYTYGKHNPQEDRYLLDKQIVPVLIDGVGNYCVRLYIHRELFGESY